MFRCTRGKDYIPTKRSDKRDYSQESRKKMGIFSKGCKSRSKTSRSKASRSNRSLPQDQTSSVPIANTYYEISPSFAQQPTASKCDPCSCSQTAPTNENDLVDMQLCRWWGYKWLKKREDMIRQQLIKDFRKELKKEQEAAERFNKESEKIYQQPTNQTPTKLTKEDLKNKRAWKDTMQKNFKTPCSSVIFNNCYCNVDGGPPKGRCTSAVVLEQEHKLKICKAKPEKTAKPWVVKDAQSSVSEISHCMCMTSSRQRYHRCYEDTDNECHCQDDNLQYLQLKMRYVQSDDSCSCEETPEPSVEVIPQPVQPQMENKEVQFKNTMLDQVTQTTIVTNMDEDCQTSVLAGHDITTQTIILQTKEESCICCETVPCKKVEKESKKCTKCMMQDVYKNKNYCLKKPSKEVKRRQCVCIQKESPEIIKLPKEKKCKCSKKHCSNRSKSESEINIVMYADDIESCQSKKKTYKYKGCSRRTETFGAQVCLNDKHFNNSKECYVEKQCARELKRSYDKASHDSNRTNISVQTNEETRRPIEYRVNYATTKTMQNPFNFALYPSKFFDHYDLLTKINKPFPNIKRDKSPSLIGVNENIDYIKIATQSALRGYDDEHNKLLEAVFKAIGYHQKDQKIINEMVPTNHVDVHDLLQNYHLMKTIKKQLPVHLQKLLNEKTCVESFLSKNKKVEDHFKESRPLIDDSKNGTCQKKDCERNTSGHSPQNPQKSEFPAHEDHQKSEDDPPRNQIGENFNRGNNMYSCGKILGKSQPKKCWRINDDLINNKSKEYGQNRSRYYGYGQNEDKKTFEDFIDNGLKKNRYFENKTIDNHSRNSILINDGITSFKNRNLIKTLRNARERRSFSSNDYFQKRLEMAQLSRMDKLSRLNYYKSFSTILNSNKNSKQILSEIKQRHSVMTSSMLGAPNILESGQNISNNQGFSGTLGNLNSVNKQSYNIMNNVNIEPSSDFKQNNFALNMLNTQNTPKNNQNSFNNQVFSGILGYSNTFNKQDYHINNNILNNNPSHVKNNIYPNIQNESNTQNMSTSFGNCQKKADIGLLRKVTDEFKNNQNTTEIPKQYFGGNFSENTMNNGQNVESVQQETQRQENTQIRGSNPFLYAFSTDENTQNEGKLKTSPPKKPVKKSKIPKSKPLSRGFSPELLTLMKNDSLINISKDSFANQKESRTPFNIQKNEQPFKNKANNDLSKIPLRSPRNNASHQPLQNSFVSKTGLFSANTTQNSNAKPKSVKRNISPKRGSKPLFNYEESIPEEKAEIEDKTFENISPISSQLSANNPFLSPSNSFDNSFPSIPQSFSSMSAPSNLSSNIFLRPNMESNIKPINMAEVCTSYHIYTNDMQCSTSFIESDGYKDGKREKRQSFFSKFCAPLGKKGSEYSKGESVAKFEKNVVATKFNRVLKAKDKRNS